MQTKPNILISRTDSIGDVVLTLPMAGWLKKQNPDCRVLFLGRSYTKDVIALSEHVDAFINYDELEKQDRAAQINFLLERQIDFFVHVFPNKTIAKLAKAAKIKFRIGTTNRIYHWFTCNKLIPLSRKNSNLHEAQLNIQLLSFLNANTNVPLQDIHQYYGFSNLPRLTFDLLKILDPNKKKIILHPKSKGSAKEWGLDNFGQLIDLLPAEKFQIFISGTKQDADQMQDFLVTHQKAMNITGKLSLAEFIVFIAACDILVAASTGPLHIAAALQKQSIGLYTSKRPMHPGRWAPLGLKAQPLVFDADCEKCQKGEDCNCIQNISPQKVIELIA